VVKYWPLPLGTPAAPCVWI